MARALRTGKSARHTAGLSSLTQSRAIAIMGVLKCNQGTGTCPMHGQCLLGNNERNYFPFVLYWTKKDKLLCSKVRGTPNDSLEEKQELQFHF